MKEYAVFFDCDNKTYRLPVNPEKIEVTSTQSIEKYNILKLGQIAMPTHMELKEYSFEFELPHFPLYYIETPAGFKGPDFYLQLFEEWREGLKPIRFIASNGIGNDINTLALIEELSTEERAGEEGDKYVSIKLLEYKKYGKKTMIIPTPVKTVATVKKAPPKAQTSPKNKGSYVVRRGDTLWGISKKYYGNGAQYSKIFNANRDKIKNPNLIYPGQKLVIP